MKRSSSLIARARRVPQGSSRAVAAAGRYRRSLSTHTSSLRNVNGSPLVSTCRRQEAAMFSHSRFESTSSSRGSVAVTRETEKKVPVSAEEFDTLKQFLMHPVTEGDAALAAKATVTNMMERHVYADMSGQEAAVMSMVADAMEDYAFVVDVYKCLRRAHVPPSPMTLELTADACAHTGDWQTAHDVIDQMHAAVDTMHPSIDIYENAVRACHHAKKWMQGKQLLEAIKHYNLGASVDIHLQVIETSLLCKELTATTRLFHDFLQAFPELDADGEVQDVLRGLLDMAMENEVLDHALFFRDQLAQRQIHIDRATYEQLIQLSARQGMWHSARVLLAHATKARALPVAAPSYQYTRDTEQLVADMDTHGFEIPMEVYNAALRAYGGTASLHKAQRLLETMATRGVSPDTVSYAAVLCSCGSDLDKSQWYFDKLCATKTLPMSMDVFHGYLLAASRGKHWQVVIDRYNHLLHEIASQEQKKQMNTDQRIQSCVAIAFGQLTQNEQMLRVFTNMKIHGLVPNLYVYVEAMSAYTRQGQWRHALMLFDHMWTEDEMDKDKLRQFPLPWDAAVHAAIAGDDTERLQTLYQQIIHHHGRLRPHTAATLIEAMQEIPTAQIWADFKPLAYLFDRRDNRNNGNRNGNRQQDNSHESSSWHVVNAVLKRAVHDRDGSLAETIVKEAESRLLGGRGGGSPNNPFNAMTYSLMLSLYARQRDHKNMLKWCKKMANAKSKMTVHTMRALLQHLETLAHDASEDGEGSHHQEMDVDAFAQAIARVISSDCTAGSGSSLRSYTSTSDLARRLLDLWEARGHALDMKCLDLYVGLCDSFDQLEDVFDRLEESLDGESKISLDVAPEFVHTLFLAVHEYAPQLLEVRFRNFLIDCLDTQPRETAIAALGVYCSWCSPQDTLQLFKTLVLDSKDKEQEEDQEEEDEEEEEPLDDEQLVLFLTSCTLDKGGDFEADTSTSSNKKRKNMKAVEDDTLVAVDVEQLHRFLTVIRDHDVSLGAGAVTFLLRTMLSLSRNKATQQTHTITLIKTLVAEALQGSSRDELRSFLEEIAQDPQDVAHLDAFLELI